MPDATAGPLTVQLHALGPQGVSACWADQYDATAIDATAAKLEARR